MKDFDNAGATKKMWPLFFVCHWWESVLSIFKVVLKIEDTGPLIKNGFKKDPQKLQHLVWSVHDRQKRGIKKYGSSNTSSEQGANF